MVPVAVWTIGNDAKPPRLWSGPRLGRNCVALPSPVGRSRASFFDQPRQGDAWQWTSVVLPHRRFRHGIEEGARAGGAARGRLSREPPHRDQGVLAARSLRLLFDA